jgi:RNA polymerase sigma factor (sigma-70 family)
LIDIHTDPDSGQHGHEFIFDETVDYRAPRFRGQANPSNLTERRWREPILSAGEVADAMRATKGPEPAAAAAKNQLAQAFHRLVLKEAKTFCGDRVDRNDDLIAAGMLGLPEAIDRFDPRRNNGLTAYAIPLIRGRMRATAKAFNRNGWSSETRLQRLVYGNHDVTPEQASKVMNRPVDEGEIEEARTQVLGMCSELLEHDTREKGFENEHDEEGKPCLVAVAPPCPRQRIFDATLVQRHGSLEWLAEDADRRATQRLKEIGRRAYALELVERDRARIAAPVAHLFKPRPRGYLFEEQPKALPRRPAQDVRKLGGRKDRSATTYHTMRIEAFESRSPAHRYGLTGYAPCRDPAVRRCADRSFNPDHVRRKKRPPEYWPSVHPTWGSLPIIWRCNEPAALAA